MASEINIQATITLQRASVSLQGVGSANANSTTNGNGLLNVQCIPNSDTAINIGNISFSAAGFLFVKNLDTGHYIEVGYDDSGTRRYFTKLRPTGEFCLIPVEPGKTYYAKASSGSTNYIQVAAIEASDP